MARNDLPGFGEEAISQEQVTACLRYDPISGRFERTSKVDNHGGKVGNITSRGYLRIKIKERYFMAHRLAWLISYGAWPKGQIDHINCIKLDNRLCNLRCVTNAVNSQNRRHPTANNKSSSFLGVSKAERGRWRAVIVLRGKKHRLGRFATPEQAHAAYVIAKRRLHEGNTL